MPSQEAECCLVYLVKGGEWAAALDSVTFWPSGKFLAFFFSSKQRRWQPSTSRGDAGDDSGVCHGGSASFSEKPFQRPTGSWRGSACL